MKLNNTNIPVRKDLYNIPAYDIGTLCTYCGEDTSATSGNRLFVNRIASEADAVLTLSSGGKDIEFNINVEGYMCSQCQMIPCDACGLPTLDYIRIDALLYCEECVPDTE